MAREFQEEVKKKGAGGGEEMSLIVWVEGSRQEQHKQTAFSELHSVSSESSGSQM